MSVSFENNGFEDYTGRPWTWENQAKITTDEAHSGFRSAVLPDVYAFPILPLPKITQKNVGTFKLTSKYTITAWIKVRAQGPGVDARLYFATTPNNPYIFEVVKELRHTELAAGWNLVTLVEDFEPIATEMTFFIQAGLYQPQTFQQVWWWVDDIEVGLTEVLLQTFEAALVADLQKINGTGIYETTVKTVGTEPKAANEVDAPAIFIIPGGGGEDEINELGQRSGLAEQRWILQLYVRSATPYADVMILLDDVRNAINPKTSNLNALSNVRWAMVESWPDAPRTSTDINDMWGMIQCTVALQYQYEIGAL